MKSSEAAHNTNNYTNNNENNNDYIYKHAYAGRMNRLTLDGWKRSV
jgi:hypothetical protein